MSRIGDVIVKMLLKSDDYEKGLTRAKKTTQSFSASIAKGFTVAAAKIGVLVGAIAGITKAFDKVSQANQAFGDRWASFTSGLKGAWDEFIRSVASADFSNLVSRLHDASVEARNLYDAFDAMGEIMTSYNIASAKQGKHLAQLRVEMNNQNLSLETRIAKAREYLSIMQDLEKMPLRGLSRVSDVTISKTMKQMGFDFAGLSQTEIAEAKKSFIDFFEWLGSEAGESAFKKITATDNKDDIASGKFAKTFQNIIQRSDVPGGKQWVDWLVQYNRKVSDEDRKALEDAFTNFLKADAAYDESTRRVQTTLNNLLFQQSKGSEKSPAADLSQSAADLRASFEALGELPKLPDIIGQAETELPDLISDEWIARQQAQGEKLAAFLAATTEKCQTIAYDFSNAVNRGVVSSIDILADAIGKGEELDGGAVVSALLSPLADACISAGILIMTTGTAIEALRDSLISGLVTGGISAIAAGAALIAVGAAAKVGLAAIGSGKGASSTSSTASATSGANSVQTVDSELTINVTGTIRGSDIVIAGQRQINSWSR